MCPIHREKGPGFWVTIQPGQALKMTYKRKTRNCASCMVVKESGRPLHSEYWSPCLPFLQPSAPPEVPSPFKVDLDQAAPFLILGVAAQPIE